MTRINLVNPKFMLDQHLLAEYRELPRVFNFAKEYKDIPKEYCLGSGHIKFFSNKLLFLFYRYIQIFNELIERNFKVTFDIETLKNKLNSIDNTFKKDYIPSEKEIKLSAERLVNKFKEKPNFYKYYKKSISDYNKNILM
jgi:deoxyribonuclease (pyrimidine dimer)